MKIFYADYNKHKEVSSSDPLEMELGEALQSFSNVADAKENFWGISIDEHRTLHFKYDENSHWVAHIPSQELKGSHKKACTREQCLELIEDVFNKNDLIVPEGFEFEKW